MPWRWRLWTRDTRESKPPRMPKAHHMALCLVAYLIVERERLDRGLTWVRLKRHLILTGASEALPALERVRKAA